MGKHGIKRPKVWNRPVAKVFELNRTSGKLLYQPMLNYIDRKELSISYSGFENKPHVRLATVLDRIPVEMPSADEMYQLLQQPEEYCGPLRLENFLVNARLHSSRRRTRRLCT